MHMIWLFGKTMKEHEIAGGENKRCLVGIEVIIVTTKNGALNGSICGKKKEE